MKVVEIVPRERTRLYGMLVAKEAAIRKGGRGTYVRVGRKTQDSTRWKHTNYRARCSSNAGVRGHRQGARNGRGRTQALVVVPGFVDRHSGDQSGDHHDHYR